MINEMLTVLMDGIKDANMLVDYACDAMHAGMNIEADFFRDHAEQRYDKIVEDQEWIMRYIGIPEKVRQGDPISVALNDYVNYQIKDLRHRIDDL